MAHARAEEESLDAGKVLEPVIVRSHAEQAGTEVGKGESRLQRLARDVIVAVVIGLLQVLQAISLAALVFSGDLSGFVARGIGFALVGTVGAAVAIALMSSLPATLGGAQNAPAAILAVIAANISAAMVVGASPEARFATVAVTLTLTGLVTGGFLLCLGWFRLGNLVRYLPHPVVGGFLAGTGWLLSAGALTFMAEAAAPRGSGIRALLAPDALSLWLPGLSLALLLLVASSYLRHYLVVPGTLLAAVAAFYLVVWASGTPFAELGGTGWVLGPFPTGELWQPLAGFELRQVDWGVILTQAPAMATVLPVAAVAVLLNASGLEVATGSDMDPNRELRGAGVAGLLSGAAAGLPGYHQLALTLLARRMRASTRAVGLLAAAVAGLALFVGASTLSLVPKFLLGGMLLYIGLGLMKAWLIDAWARLPRIEYAVIATIVVVIATVGFLEGVAVGVVAAVVMFVVAYSRIDVVRHESSGVHLTSRVTRAPGRREALRRHGHRILVLQLQGFIFFGTGDVLLRRVRARLAASERPPGYVVLDFRRVTGLDTTAAVSLVRLHRAARRHGAHVVLTDVPGEIRTQLRIGGVEASSTLRFMPDLDQGLEWCEEHVLAELDEGPAREGSLEEHLAQLLPEDAGWRALLPYLTRRHLHVGERLVGEGDPADQLYFLSSGTLSARLERPGAAPVRLETMGAGTMVGELGFFLREPRTASVVAEDPAVVHGLDRDAFERMQRDDPRAALALHRLVVRLVSERARHLMGAVRALER